MGEEERRRMAGEVYLKYVEDNDQAKEGKVLRIDLYAACRAPHDIEDEPRKAASLARLTQVT